MDRTVLVVEDDVEINEFVGAYVQIAGFSFIGATDGASGLRAAAQRPCSLVILDLMLPDMSGFEVCSRLKADERTRAVPVLFLSALDHEETRARGAVLGGVGHMAKPFKPEALIEAVRRLALP